MILKHSRIFSLIIILLSAQLSWAVDASYYSSLNSKSGTTLFSAVTTVCGTGWGTGTGTISYKGLWTTYQTTDANSDGSLIADVYSTCEFTTTAAVLAKNNDGVGGYCSGISYSTYCDCYNREHTVPQSWWGGGETVPYGVDVVHVLPTDGKVNSQRSSHPLGECSSGTVYGSISKLGTSTFSTGSYNANGKSYTVSHVYDGSDQVWEPADDYKGDFARIYFYMAAKYSPTLDMTTGEGANMFLYNSGYGLTDYSVDLLLKWHRQDPVSLREINRNDKIQETQGNRNPFVDYPDLAEYIWGENAGSSFSTSSATATFTTDYKSTAKTGIYGQDTNKPTITVSNTTLTLDPAPQYGSSSTTFTVVGSNLTGAISLALGGTNSGMFSISSTSIAKANANSSNSITVTYNPTALGSHYATITLTSTSASNVVINLSGTCAVVRTVTWYDDEGQYEQNTVATGFAPSVPAINPEDCSESRVFVGWTTSGGYTGESAPDGMFTDEAPTVNTDAEFYAVYADKETTGGDPVETEKFATTSLGSTNSVTTGYTVSATLSAKTGYYQDGSTVGTKYHVNIYNTSTPMFTSTPSSIDLTVSIGGGTDGLSFDNYAYAQLVNASGDTIGTAAKITNSVTTATGDSYNVSIPTTGVTSAYGIRLYHAKESGKNMRFYSASLSITTGGTTTTYSNYSTDCNEGTKVTITFNANGGEGTMAAQQVPQSTSRTLNANTFTRSHYTFNGWNTQANGSGTSYADGASINTSTDLTLYAQWTEASQYTVTFKNNGVTYATKTNYEGETITDVADPTACEGYTFEGWSTQTYAADNTSAATIDYTGTIPASNTTYYAVYSKTESSGDPVATNNYKKITSKSELTDGNYLIVANNSEAYNAMSTTFKNTYYLEGSSVTPDDDIITTTMANIIWQINVSDDQATIYNATSHYLYIESSTSGTKTYYNIKLGDNTTNNKFSYEVSNGEWIFTSATYTDRQIEYYTTYTRWAYHTSQDAPVYLYKQQYEASSTTYHTTSPNCCKATLTVQSPDDTMGTVSIGD